MSTFDFLTVKNAIFISVLAPNPVNAKEKHNGNQIVSKALKPCTKIIPRLHNKPNPLIMKLISDAGLTVF
jgi:hypothetical protein